MFRYLLAAAGTFAACAAPIPTDCVNLGFPVNCPRDSNDGIVSQPPNIYSQNGFLDLDLTFLDRDASYFCYMTREGFQAPTLRMRPKDVLRMNFKNCFQTGYSAGIHEMVLDVTHECGSRYLTKTSTNLHFHGAVIPAYCHEDLILTSIVNYGEQYRINFSIPEVKQQSPGIFWYHPHIHGVAATTVKGGASGVLVVEGIENVQPAVQGLPEQILVLRQSPPDSEKNMFSINFAPFNITASSLYPTMLMKPQQKQFWRILNAAANTYFRLVLEYDGVPQNMTVVAIDGVPVFRRDTSNREKNVLSNNRVLMMPPGSRFEIIITTPAVGQVAFFQSVADGTTFFTAPIDGKIARLVADVKAPNPPVTIPMVTPQGNQFFLDRAKEWEEVYAAKPHNERHLKFSQYVTSSVAEFYVSLEDNPKPSVFEMDSKPLITVFNNVTEDWTIKNNATMDAHTFHIHQGHFMLLKQNGQDVPLENVQFMDNVNIPPSSSVVVRIDFSKFEIGEFVFHCHILGHEDGGMMQKISVKDASLVGTNNGGGDNNQSLFLPLMTISLLYCCTTGKVVCNILMF
jgi:FtsP/CotA-like multicopper oxidase with cupredoxin domain